MKKPKVFLTARWQDLILITYDVDPEILLSLIPTGFEPDTINGRGFLSLVAFDFLDTKVKGFKIPYHVNFPEINFRLYVKNKDIRGVVFIREFVPKAFIPIIANTLYNENYKAFKMTSSVKKNGAIFINHTIEINNNKYEINLQADNKPFLPPSDSTEHFFKEHEWGFGNSKSGKPIIYKVEHPFWNIYPIIKFEHNFDFGAIYGKKWLSLNNQTPYTVTYAQGSEIKLFEGEVMQ